MRPLVVAVLTLDAVLLALTEIAWITARIPVGPPAGFALGAWLVVVGAAVTTPLLVRGADRARPGTRAPMLPLAAWTVTVLVGGVWSPAGGGVLPADSRTLLLVAAGLVPGVVALSRPVRPVAAGEGLPPGR